MKKPSLSQRRNPEGLDFPRTLSVEEQGWLWSSRAGFLALGSSPHPQPSHSARGGTVAVHHQSDGLWRCGSPITVAGPRPNLTAFPFPRCTNGAPQEHTLSNPWQRTGS